jgi:hypothetical protein
MQLETVNLAVFSPTGTSMAVGQAVVQGLAPSAVQIGDLTDPAARTTPLQTTPNDLLVVAVPVYMGRVPALLHDWLSSLRAQDTLAVC